MIDIAGITESLIRRKYRELENSIRLYLEAGIPAESLERIQWPNGEEFIYVRRPGKKMGLGDTVSEVCYVDAGLGPLPIDQLPPEVFADKPHVVTES